MGTKTYDNANDLITFSRASGGTALRKISYGSELVTNGTFDTDTDWTLDDGWSISGGVLSKATDSGNGKTAAQAVNFVAGRTYLVEFDYTDQGSDIAFGYGTLGTNAGLLENNTPLSGTGPKTITITPSFDGGFLGFRGQNASVGQVDNISVKEVLFDQPAGTLTLYNHPNDMPRIEYDAAGAVKGLLIEEARTNLFTDSVGFTGWGTTRALISPSSTTGVDGVANSAHTISGNATGTSSSLISKTNWTVSTSSYYTASSFFKAGDTDWVALAILNFTTPANAWAYFDLVNGVVGTVDAGLTANIESFGNGWYRCSVTFLTDVADTTGDTRIYLSDADGDLNINLDVAQSIYQYGFQFEAGSFPTSYIPTSGATATRAADIASIPRTIFGHHEDASTWLVEFTPLYPEVDTNQFLLSRAGSGYDFHIASYSGNKIHGVWTGNATGRGDIVAGQTSKVAVVVADNEYLRAAVDGTVLADGTSLVDVSNWADVEYTLGGNQLGHIKSIQYYPRRLTNAQLQELTT